MKRTLIILWLLFQSIAARAETRSEQVQKKEEEKARQDARAKLCKNFRSLWEITTKSDLKRGMVATLICRNGDQGMALRFILRAMDDGDVSAVFPAGALYLCRKLDEHDYEEWRVCRIMAARADEEQVDAAFGTEMDADIPEWARSELKAGAEAGRARIETVRSAMEDVEKGWPDRKTKVDDAEAAAKAAALDLAGVSPSLDELEAFYESLAKGPGFAEGCEDKLRPAFEAAVASRSKGATGDGLRAAVEAPGPYLIGKALARCREALRDLDGARYVERAISGGTGTTGFWDTYVDAIGGSLFGDKVNKWRHPGLGGRVTGGNRPVEDVVAKVQKKKGVAVISFKKRTEMAEIAYDCKEGKVAKVVFRGDEAEIVRDEDCKWKMAKQDITTEPISVPAADVAAVAKGSTIAIDPDRKDEGVGRVLWVRKGKDIVWYFGFTAK